MKGYLKPIISALKHKGIAYPVYAVLGTSAAYLIKHFFFSNGKHKGDNFRAGATQFDQKQLGTLEPEASQTGRESTIGRKDKTIVEETLPPQSNMPAEKIQEESYSKPELLPEDQEEISEQSLIGAINEVTAPVDEQTQQCRAITKKGTRCRNKADNSGYCRIHKAAQ